MLARFIRSRWSLLFGVFLLVWPLVLTARNRPPTAIESFFYGGRWRSRGFGYLYGPG
jgi:hypothetical protein